MMEQRIMVMSVILVTGILLNTANNAERTAFCYPPKDITFHYKNSSDSNKTLWRILNGTEVYGECSPGFRGQSQKVMCIDGVLEPSHLECEPERWCPPVTVQFGSVEPSKAETSSMPIGSVVEFRCNDQTSIGVHSWLKAKCHFPGWWDHEPTTCNLKCIELDVENGYHMNIYFGDDWGTHSHYALLEVLCSTNENVKYELENPLTSLVTCRNGTWFYLDDDHIFQPIERVRCLPVEQCTEPKIDYAVEHKTGVTSMESVEFTCNTDGVMDPVDYTGSICYVRNGIGEWDPPLPKCYRPCQQLTMEKDNVKVENGIHGEDKLVSCEQGYNSSSPITRCINGTFSPTPVCIEAGQCTGPKIDYAVENKTGVTNMESVEFICNTDGVMDPADYTGSICYVRSGIWEWEPPLPKCYRPCEELREEEDDVGVKSALHGEVKPVSCKAGFWSSSANATCNNGTFTPTPVCNAIDCAVRYYMGNRSSGVYTIYPDGDNAIRAYCDMEREGGGWTVFQKRFSGEVDFFRDWEEYAAGFGNPEGEYWLGLRHVHEITQTRPSVLYVGLTDFDLGDRYTKYGTFNISSEAEKFRLTVGSSSGNAGNSLGYGSGKKFTTRDEDNDSWDDGNFSNRWHGAWWYSPSHISNLNGRFSATKAFGNEYMLWYHLHNNLQSMKASVMMMRPANFKP